MGNLLSDNRIDGLLVEIAKHTEEVACGFMKIPRRGHHPVNARNIHDSPETQDPGIPESLLLNQLLNISEIKWFPRCVMTFHLAWGLWLRA